MSGREGKMPINEGEVYIWGRKKKKGWMKYACEITRCACGCKIFSFVLLSPNPPLKHQQEMGTHYKEVNE